MSQDSSVRRPTLSVPPPQQAARTAHRQAVESLRGQAEPQLRWLGVEGCDPPWRLPVMDRVFLVDPHRGEVWLDDQSPVRPEWQILTLHYLAVRSQPMARSPEITFASLPSARAYASVYENRVNRRLCAAIGHDLRLLQSAAAAMHAQPVDGGDLAFEMRVFPRIPLRLIGYAGDEELTSSCTLLLPANIESFLSTEDIVVLSEAFVSRIAQRVAGR